MVARRQVLRGLGVGAAGLVGLAWQRPARAQDEVAVGRVTRQVGTALVVRGQATEPLAVGAEILVTDRLITQAGSRLEITFTDGTLTVLGPSTDVAVATFVLAGDSRGEGVLSMLSGVVRATVAPGSGGFAIEGRVAVASVRSTELIVEVVEDRMSVLSLEGIVDVRHEGETVGLEPGVGVDVRAGEPLPEPRAWAAPRVADVVARTTLP